jgi:hypothetical protein
LLGSIGIEIATSTPADVGGGAVFLTNAVLCLKDGGMQTKVMPECFTNCGVRFLRPTIDLIMPKAVEPWSSGEDSFYPTVPPAFLCTTAAGDV